MDNKNSKNESSDLSFEEIITRNSKKEKVNNEEEKPKLVDFKFDEIVKKSKKTSVKPTYKKIKQHKNIFKYKNFIFRNINDIKTFLLLEYQKKEEHATNLLNDQEFLKWLEIKINDKDIYKSWLENVYRK